MMHLHSSFNEGREIDVSYYVYLIKENTLTDFELTIPSVGSGVRTRNFERMREQGTAEIYTRAEYIHICNWIDGMDKKELLLNTRHKLAFVKKWCYYRIKYDCKVIRS